MNFMTNVWTKAVKRQQQQQQQQQKPRPRAPQSDAQSLDHRD